ncbi:MAG: ABC transporter ATP-binding protein [Ponticaulis sp.]|nr:ABC transporter ATP-binding protein [Ponticaulis sp.]
MTEAIIDVKGLRTQFGDHVVHDNLDMTVYRGETIGVIGPSGCGKSVLLSEIVGLLEPAAGEIRVFGQDLDALSAGDRRQIEQRWAVMFQDGALFSNLTVRENVMAPMREHTDFSEQLMSELADLKIRMAGLTVASAPKHPSDLSGGMRKRAALARALALDPELLFLDEPTAGLDPITAGKFDDLLKELSRLLGLTVFLVTHDLDTLKATCDRIAVLGDKRVKFIGPLAEVAQVDDPWIQEYFGGPRGRAVV